MKESKLLYVNGFERGQKAGPATMTSRAVLGTEKTTVEKGRDNGGTSL